MVEQGPYQSVEAILQRISTLERNESDDRAAMRTLSSRNDERFASLETKLEERSRAPWSNIISACGVTILVVGVVGGLAFSPLRESISGLNEDYRYLTRGEVVPRREHEEKWRSHDKDIENIRQRLATESADKQRQIDAISTKYTDIYSAPQMIKDLNERIRQLENMRSWEARTVSSGK